MDQTEIDDIVSEWVNKGVHISQETVDNCRQLLIMFSGIARGKWMSMESRTEKNTCPCCSGMN